MLLDDPALRHLAAVAGGDGVVSAPGEVSAHGALGQAEVQHGVGGGLAGEHGCGYMNCRVRTVLSRGGGSWTLYTRHPCARLGLDKRGITFSCSQHHLL